MVHQSSSTELRTLSADEVEAVAGSGTFRYMNGDTLVTEHYDSEGWFTGATYDRADGSGSWFDTAGNSGSWGASSNWGNGSYGYASGGFGAYGIVGGISHVYGGDTYAYIGIGTPGPAATAGVDADGDLSGWSVGLPAGATGLVVDPTTGVVTQVEVGLTSPDITYGVNLNEIGRSLYGTVEAFSEGFIREYYPEQIWNPNYQPEQR